jgi:hypothetical protein
MAVITTRGGTEMESVYGRKRLAANAGVRATWMDRFTQLEPEGGFRSGVQLAWSHSAPTPNRASQLNSINGRMEMEPVYGQKCLSADAGVRETWMDRFTKLEPDSGFSAIVERAWNWSTPTSDKHLTTLAA